MRQSRVNHFQNRFQFTENLIVPEPEDAVALLMQESAASFILRLLFRMLPTVQFDHQPVLKTNEVDDERPDRLLPPEFAARKLSVTQPAPE